MSRPPAFAQDAAVPARDALLDTAGLAPRLDALLGAGGPLGIEQLERIRAKYRVGRGLGLLFRVRVAGADHLVSARSFEPGGAARNLERALAGAHESPPGALLPVAFAPELETVFWTFPNDRRIRSLALVAGPSDELARLAGGPCAPRLVAYVPEKAATARCEDETGAARAYVKVYGGEEGARADAVHAAIWAAASTVPGLRVPRPLAFDPHRRALALEAIDGEPLETRGAAGLGARLAALGAALATLHAASPPVGLPPLERLAPAKLERAGELIARVRPDVGDAARKLAEALAATFDQRNDPAWLHGDAHPKNVVVTRDGVALVDLDQAAIGPAAADLGGVLSRLRHLRLVGVLSADRERALMDSLLRGYGSVREPPDARSIAWHLAASLLGERALRAVTRVRPEDLGYLGELIEAAGETCPRPSPARFPRCTVSELAARRSGRPALLLHCQHAVGLGHLTRSLALAGALSQRFDVVVLSGGKVPRHVTVPPGVELVQLPPLARDRRGRLVSADGRRTVERASTLRRQLILEAVAARRPAVVVVELFPFGRRAFTGELLMLIEAARSLPDPALVACSLRDILVGRGEKQRAFDERACGIANSHLDAILVHADPRFARLEESFRPRSPLRVPVHYTGFVSAAPNAAPGAFARARRVVVSAGGGSVGLPLLRAAVEAQPELRRTCGLAMRVIAGTFLAEDSWRELRASARGREGLGLRRSVPDLSAELRSAAVSVSQCGYNTALEVLRARVPALVVPYAAPGEDEQARRAARLAGLGAVRALPPRDLDAGALVREVRALVGTDPPRLDLDLDGSGTSAEVLWSLLGSPARAAGEGALA
jgi:predicted glycosyltransferase/tRNA A-37 threonylcarbamoyl transferase component Bud32